MNFILGFLEALRNVVHSLRIQFQATQDSTVLADFPAELLESGFRKHFTGMYSGLAETTISRPL